MGVGTCFVLKGQGIAIEGVMFGQDSGGLSLVLRSFQGIFGPPSLPCFAFVCAGFFQSFVMMMVPGLLYTKGRQDEVGTVFGCVGKGFFE